MTATWKWMSGVEEFHGTVDGICVELASAKASYGMRTPYIIFRIDGSSVHLNARDLDDAERVVKRWMKSRSA